MWVCRHLRSSLLSPACQEQGVKWVDQSPATSSQLPEPAPDTAAAPSRRGAHSAGVACVPVCLHRVC